MPHPDRFLLAWISVFLRWPDASGAATVFRWVGLYVLVMAFIFPASFETEEQYLRACASRLERFFGRKFRIKRSANKKKFVYVSPDIAKV